MQSNDISGNINAASRLLSVLTRIPAHSDDTHTLEVWASLFEIEEKTSWRPLAVAERLSAMYRELDAVREKMHGTAIDEDVYGPAISMIEHALSTFLFPTAWSQARQYLTPEALGTLLLCSAALPPEEAPIDAQWRASIAERVEELTEVMVDVDSSSSTQALMSRQISAFRRMNADYAIAGAKAMSMAALGAFIELDGARAGSLSRREENEIDNLAAFWKKVEDRADTALKIE